MLCRWWYAPRLPKVCNNRESLENPPLRLSQTIGLPSEYPKMVTSIISTVVFLVFVLLIHRGGYSPPPCSSEKPNRDYIEASVLVGCLLIVPFVKFNLFWYSGWQSAYLVFGVLSPLIMELVLRKRKLSVIGFRMPTNKKVLFLIAGIIGLYMISRLVVPLFVGAAYTFNWRGFVSNAIIFAFLEEVVFRGLIQTRLESALGAVWSWVLTGLFFGFYHYYVHYLVTGQALTIANLFELLFLTAFGMMLGVIFAKTRSLIPSYLIHAVNNLSLFTM